MKRGELQYLMRDVERTYDLEANFLDRYKYAIRRRALRNNPCGIGESQRSPMEAAELFIVVYCLKCSGIGQPLTHEQVRTLAASLLAGT